MLDIFGQETRPPNPQGKGRLAERQHKQLITIYGKVDDKCKNCKHFYVRKFSGTYFKCKLATQDGGPGTDWRANWQACGKFEKK